MRIFVLIIQYFDQSLFNVIIYTLFHYVEKAHLCITYSLVSHWKNINKRSLYVKREEAYCLAIGNCIQTPSRVLLFNSNWLCIYFRFLHTVVLRNACYLDGEIKSLLIDGSFIFFVKEKNTLCLSDHCSEKQDIIVRRVHFYFIFFTVIYSYNYCNCRSYSIPLSVGIIKK